jgi:hypothetical protein
MFHYSGLPSPLSTFLDPPLMWYWRDTTHFHCLTYTPHFNILTSIQTLNRMLFWHKKSAPICFSFWIKKKWVRSLVLVCNIALVFTTVWIAPCFILLSSVERSLFQIIFDLYAAGSETSSTALQWIILYLIKYPVVQIKCISEIRRVSIPSINVDNRILFLLYPLPHLWKIIWRCCTRDALRMYNK